MIQLSTLSNRMAAAVAALALSLTLFGGTVSTPSPAQAHVLYVGAVA